MILPSPFANHVAPFVPVGTAPVSEESREQKRSAFKPLEEPSESARYQQRRPVQSGDDQDGQAWQRDLEDQRRQEAELEQIRQLAARDREVRAHEQAHAAVAGHYASAPRYQYERGPDGVSYAVAGSVQVDTTPVPDDPEATIAKAQQIRRAAYAPAEPSPEDRRVAAEALRMELEARAELRRREAEEAREEDESDGKSTFSSAANQKEEEEERRLKRSEILEEMSRKNLDLNRRLIEIGVLPSPRAIGVLLDRNA